MRSPGGDPLSELFQQEGTAQHGRGISLAVKGAVQLLERGDFTRTGKLEGAFDCRFAGQLLAHRFRNFFATLILAGSARGMCRQRTAMLDAHTANIKKRMVMAGLCKHRASAPRLDPAAEW